MTAEPPERAEPELSQRLWRSFVHFFVAPPRRLEMSSRTREGLGVSVLEGGVATIYTALTSGAYLTGYVLLLGFGEIHLSLLGAIPMLATLPGLLAAWAAERAGTRKRYALPAHLLSRLLWLPMMALALLPISPVARIWGFLGLFLLSSLFGSIGTMLWQGWMGDLVPKSLRGRFWGRRNQLIQIVTIAAMFFTGALLDAFRERGAELYGYLLLMVVAVAFGIASVAALRRQPEGPVAQPESFDLWQNAREVFGHRGYRPVLMGMAMFQFSIGLISPFVASYMLRYLHMTFSQISAVTILSLVVGIFAGRYWGHVMDRHGIRPVVMINCFVTGFVAISWTLAMTFGMPAILVVWVLSGIGWVGFNMAVLNLPFALAPREGMTYFLAIQNILAGLVFFVGTTIGGIVAQALEGFEAHLFGLHIIHYHVLYVLSASGRFLAIIPFSRIRDVRSRPVAEVLSHTSSILWTKLISAGQAGRSAVLAGRRRPTD